MSEQIDDFNVVLCDMVHEKVISSKTSKEGETHFERLPLCPLKERNLRLGCAHSAANIRYERLLEQLPDREAITHYQRQFQQIVLAIYQLDHQKGDLEKEHFLAQESVKSSISKQLRDIVQQHQNAMKKLEALHQKVLGAV